MHTLVYRTCNACNTIYDIVRVVLHAYVYVCMYHKHMSMLYV